MKRSVIKPRREPGKLEKRISDLEAQLDICKRYAEGEGADGDCADLANDYGGTGHENSPACRAVAAMQAKLYKHSMKPNPIQIAETCISDLGSATTALRYCQTIASCPGPLSGDYSQAAAILQERAILSSQPRKQSK
jgi:hypothetical protein